MLRHYLSLISISVAALLLASCASRHSAAILNDVETYIQQRPDSALATIRAIDTTTLTSRSLRAHYALLHAMALDKNWIDTTDVNVVMPAVEYYERHGSADQKMKAYYYLGRIQENQHDYTAAILSFTIAEDASAGSIDEQFKGLLYMGIANVYREVHSVDKTLEYTEKARECFSASGDTHRFDLSTGRLAMAFQEKQDWYKADSLYQLCLQKLKQDTAYMQIYLSQYAAMKVVQPEPDPEGAISLLTIISSEYGKPLSMRDYGVYAYASALLGDDSTSEKVLSMMSRQPENRRVQARYMSYRIAEHNGDYKQALDLLKGIYRQQDTTVYELLDNSIAQTLQEYYEKQSSESQRRLVNHRLIWGFVVLLLLTAAIVANLHIKRKHEQDREKSLELEQENASLQEAVTALSDKVAEMNVQQAQLQREYTMHLQSSFREWGQLYKAYYHPGKNDILDIRENVYYEATNAISRLSGDKEGQMLLERRLNELFDDVMVHYRADFPDEAESDYHFVSFVFAGFDASILKAAFQIPSIPATYARKSRLKESIQNSSSRNKEQYLRFFR